jgi:serine/threonine-protein phosphatase 5
MIKLESYGSAIADANESIRLDPTYTKAYYRRGSAQFALGKYREAQRDFQLVEKTGQSEATAKVKACEKAIMKASFSKAIVSDTVKV